MNYSLTIQHETQTLPTGEIRLNLWVSNYSGFNDSGVFLMLDRTGLLNESPQYSSVCTAVNFVEYPVNIPEGPRGYYRSSSTSMVYPSMVQVNEALETISQRVTQTLDSMNRATDIESQVIQYFNIKGRKLTVVSSKKAKRVVYVRLLTEEPLILIKKSPSMGEVCYGICTPAEKNTLGVVVGTEQGWLVTRAEFLTYGTLLGDVIIASMDSMEALDNA